MDKYILNSFDKITKDRDSIILFSSLYNKEVTLKGENVSKYLLDGIDRLREYTSIKDFFEDMVEKGSDEVEGIYDFFEKLVEKGILIKVKEETYNFNKSICIIDFNPTDEIWGYLEKISKMGFSLQYIVPRKNNLNIEKKDYVNIMILDEINLCELDNIDMYIFLEYRFEVLKKDFLKMKKYIELKNKPVLYTTVSEKISIIGPMVTTREDVSYNDRENDILMINEYKIINKQVNSTLDCIVMSKVYIEIFKEILNFYKEGYFSNLINEYLIIDNTNSVVKRRYICSLER